MSGDALARAVEAAATGDRPVAVALMHVLMEAPDEVAARTALRDALAARKGVAAARLRAVEALWQGHPGAWAVVRAVAGGIAHAPQEATPETVLRTWAASFDRLVAASPEASVALYSLGSPALLAQATAEIVQRMAGWGLLGPAVDALDLGCGIGRLSAALAPRVRSVLGLDIAPGMVTEARRRHGALPNVRFAVTPGGDLAAVGRESLDLVLAADVFPYLVAAGGELAAAHLAEFARVLRPGGRALILNWSYRGDAEADAQEAAAAARAAALVVERAGTRDLASWDATTVLLRRS